MKPLKVWLIPHTGLTPLPGVWMLKCDGCGLLVQAFEELEGMGAVGVMRARRLAAEHGWTSEPVQDVDLCPECTEVVAA